MNLDEMEEVVGQLKAHDNEIVFEELFTNFGPLIRKFYHKYKIKGFDLEDFSQEGRIALHKAIHSYERAKSNHFAGYFKLLFYNRIQNLYKKDTAYKRGGRSVPLSLDSYIQEYYHDDVSCTALNLIEDNHQYAPEFLTIMREEISHYLSDLSKLEKSILYHYLNGTPIEAVSKTTGLSEQQIKSALHRARRKLKAAIKS